MSRGDVCVNLSQFSRSENLPKRREAALGGAGRIPLSTSLESLSREACTACRRDSPRVGADEAAVLLASLPGWETDTATGIERLTRRFAFADFRSALAFAGRVGALAEEADHHPELVVEWGATTVRWWTHTIGGLHRNDFIMAARSTEAFGQD